MKKIVGFIILFLCVYSCKPKPKVYDFEIPQNKLVGILADLHVAEAAIGQYTEEKKDSMRTLFVTEIFQIQKIDKALFDTIVSQLNYHPELNYEIQRMVFDSLKSLENKTNINQNMPSNQ
jgi:hypothetical protein